MTAIPIAKLQHRLRLEEPVRAPEAGGGATITWSLVAEIWGSLQSLGGDERMKADGLEGRVSHEIWIRHRDSMRADMRFVLDGREFDIRAVLASDERKAYLRCLVEERVP